MPDSIFSTDRILKETYDAVLRLTGRVDSLIEQTTLLRTRHDDHEERLRTLERMRWPVSSVTILVALISVGLSILTYITK